MVVIIFLVWIFFIYIFNKLKMHFFKFLVGSVGLFCFAVYFGKGMLVGPFSYLVANIVKLFENVFHFYKTSPMHSVVTVYHKQQAVSFIIDYECSGYIEAAVYSSALWFYPIYSVYEKAFNTVFGLVCIFGANVIRILFIAILVHIFGRNVLFISHTILARLLFFIIMIILYYIVFTKPHILRQKVGSFRYDDH